MLCVIRFEADRVEEQYDFELLLRRLGQSYFSTPGLDPDVPIQTTKLIITGGPHKADDTKHLWELIQRARIPMLGICLGAMAIQKAFDGAMVQGRRAEPEHVSMLHNDPIFDGLLQRECVRVAHRENIGCLPTELYAIAGDAKTGEFLAIRHNNRPIYGLMFHPEDPATNGATIVKNFLKL